MNYQLYDRELGLISSGLFSRLIQYRLLTSLQLAPHIRFSAGEAGLVVTHGAESRPNAPSTWAHQSGVNCLTIDRFDGRILLTGGADATIRLWELEQQLNPHDDHTYAPVATIRRAPREEATNSEGHTFGITGLSFYPFDVGAFLSSSHDGMLKLWATETATLSKNLVLGERIFIHSISPIASHLLVACGTIKPAVRLVDIRAGAAVHSLPAPGAGPMLAMCWSPKTDHVLASGSSDGAVRLWDIRRAGGPLGVLDLEDSVGVLGRDPTPPTASDSTASLQKAHSGSVNGILFTDDGRLVITAGHDRKIRVWNAETGANTLAAFGPLVRNGGQLGSPATMVLSPSRSTPAGKDILYWGNENEIIAFDLAEGSILSRLRGIAPNIYAVRTDPATLGTAWSGPSEQQQHFNANTLPSQARPQRSVRNRLTGLAWRGAGGCGASSGSVPGGRNAMGGLYSSHLDGQIRVWMPVFPGDDGIKDAESVLGDGDSERRRKKQKVLDDAYRSLMGTSIKFSGE